MNTDRGKVCEKQISHATQSPHLQHVYLSSGDIQHAPHVIISSSSSSSSRFIRKLIEHTIYIYIYIYTYSGIPI